MKAILLILVFASTYVSVYSVCTSTGQQACDVLCNANQIKGVCIHDANMINDVCQCAGFLVSCPTNCAKACQANDWTGGVCSGKACRCSGNRAGNYTYADPWANACVDYDDNVCSSNCISQHWRTGWCVEHVCKCTND